MKPLLLCALAVATLALAPDRQTFTGVITDEMCAKDGHGRMRMGPTDAECTLACVDIHGARLVLTAGANVYFLSDQQTPQKYAAQKVAIVGTLDAATKTIQVESITAAK